MSKFTENELKSTLSVMKSKCVVIWDESHLLALLWFKYEYLIEMNAHYVDRRQSPSIPHLSSMKNQLIHQ